MATARQAELAHKLLARRREVNGHAEGILHARVGLPVCLPDVPVRGKRGRECGCGSEFLERDGEGEFSEKAERRTQK